MSARRISACFLTVLIALVISKTVLSQYDFGPYSGKPNPQLKEELKKGKIGSLFFKETFNDGTYEKWASSTKRAEGKPPPKPKPIDSYEDLDVYGEALFAYVEWTCMYSAYSAMDNDPRTAWVEGVPGDGVGEIVIVWIDTRKPVKIWAGYGKSEDTFKKNNRPKQVRAYVLQGRLDWGRSAEGGEAYTDIHVIAKHVVTLKDLNGYQPLNLPKHAIRDKKTITFVAVEILSVYPGTKYKDTCISEIRN